MYIPPHFQWLESRQNPPPEPNNSPDDPGSQRDQKPGASPGISPRTTVGIVVCDAVAPLPFFFNTLMAWHTGIQRS